MAVYPEGGYGDSARSNIDPWFCGRQVPEKVGSAAVTISGREGIDSSVCYRRSEFGVPIRDNRPVSRFPLKGAAFEAGIENKSALMEGVL